MLDRTPHAAPRGWLSRALARISARPAPEAKASRTGAVIALEHLHQPVWSPRDYATFAREGVMQNAIVYRAVRMVAEAAASVPLLLYDGDVEIEAHPLLDLLARPNPVSTRPDLLEAWYGYLLVSGNAYLEAVAVSGSLRELHALRSDRMKVIPGPDGWPEAYEYTANGESARFSGEVAPGVRPILHVKLFHPANDHYGLSPLEAAATAIDIHNTASRWNKALLDNSARPSGALVYTARDGNLSPDQFERLKSELEAGFQGAAHAGRPLLLEGGLDWKAMSLSPKDMDFIEAKHVAAREIALALGVPPMLLGIPGDNTYSNYQEANRSFWRLTVLPLVNRTAKALSAWLSPAYDAPLELRPDLDCIDALSPERDALWSRLEKTTFLKPDEKRTAIGYAPSATRPSPPPSNTAPTNPATTTAAGKTRARATTRISRRSVAAAADDSKQRRRKRCACPMRKRAPAKQRAVCANLNRIGKPYRALPIPTALKARLPSWKPPYSSRSASCRDPERCDTRNEPFLGRESANEGTSRSGLYPASSY